VTYVQSGPKPPSLQCSAVALFPTNVPQSCVADGQNAVAKNPVAGSKVKLSICTIRQAPRMLAAPVVTSADSMPQTRPPDVVIKDFVFASVKMEFKNTIEMDIYTR
jgi:hypothetical protein